MDEEVYLTPPSTDRKPGKLWKAKRAVYGLRRALQLFQDSLQKTVEHRGFIGGKIEAQLFWKSRIPCLMVVHAEEQLHLQHGIHWHVELWTIHESEFSYCIELGPPSVIRVRS